MRCMAENISSKSISMNQDENDDELSGGNGESVDTPPEAANEFGPSTYFDNNKKENQQSIITASRIVSHTPHNSIIGSFHDHFTLPSRSSTVRFRSSNTSSRVYEDSHSQFIIEESGSKITAKQFPSGNTCLGFLRAVYTLVVLFWTGFLVVFCVQVLLFLIQDLTIQVGATSNQGATVGEALGTILSLPMYIHGLASSLVLAGHYAMDTWSGFLLFKNFVFGRWSIVTTSWMTFVFFLGLPLFIMTVCLFIGTDDWWSITALSWFSFIGFFYVFFSLTVVYFELHACLELIQQQTSNKNFSFLLKRAILLRQTSRYSGKTCKIYIARGELEDATGVCSHVDESNARYSIGWYTKFTQWTLWNKLGLFTTLEQPGERMYTVEDAHGIRPFVTRASWSLEKLYCRPKNSRYVAVISGPSAITRAQMRSSFVCSILGNALIFLLLVAALVYLGIGAGFIVIVCILVAFFWVPSLFSSYRIWMLTKDIVGIRSKTDDSDTTAADATNRSIHEEECEGVYQVWEAYRVTRATPRLCWIMFAIEWTLFFIYPMVTLFSVKNYQLAVLFVIIAALSALRYYLNAPVVLEELGSMHYIQGENVQETWKTRSRLYDVVTNVTRSRSRGAWNAVLSLFIFIFLALFLGAVGQQGDTPSDQQLAYLPDFSYVQEDDLRYPTCVLGKEIEGGPTTRALADYAYLATVAYRDTSITQNELDQWFGSNVAVDLPELVTRFRERIDSESAVSYKLISFPDLTGGQENYGIVSIRGTTNAWDMLSDAQLWSAAACMQFLRAILPIGEIWTPILSQLVNAISFFESANIDRVSFYKETTAFIKEVQESGIFKNVQVTGHSLGGGLAIISGAQTGAPAVALSGPNALISRRTFDGVTEEKLDKKVFNIIPDRDPVAHIDDVAQLNQHIACTAPKNDFVGCHYGLRSLCEIMHTCGTGIRPALCECVTIYGYPEPRPTGNRTFAEACSVPSLS